MVSSCSRSLIGHGSNVSVENEELEGSTFLEELQASLNQFLLHCLQVRDSGLRGEVAVGRH